MNRPPVRGDAGFDVPASDDPDDEDWDDDLGPDDEEDDGEYVELRAPGGSGARSRPSSWWSSPWARSWQAAPRCGSVPSSTRAASPAPLCA